MEILASIAVTVVAAVLLVWALGKKYADRLPLKMPRWQTLFIAGMACLMMLAAAGVMWMFIVQQTSS